MCNRKFLISRIELVSDCLIHFLLWLFLMIKRTGSKSQTWSSPHVIFEHSLPTRFDHPIHCLLGNFFCFELARLWEDAAPKFKPMFFCDLLTRDFDIVDVVKWNSLVIDARHAIFKLFAEGGRADDGTRFLFVLGDEERTLTMIHFIIICCLN